MDENDHRGQRRIAVTMQARMRDRTLGKFDAEIMDLSLTGFRADADYILDEGDAISLMIAGLQPLEATVTWRRGREVGCRFRQPLYPAVLDHIVKNAG